MCNFFKWHVTHQNIEFSIIFTKRKAIYFSIYLHHLLRRSKVLNWLMHRYYNELLSYFNWLTYFCFNELWSYFSKINVLLVGLKHTDTIYYKVSPPLPSPPPPPSPIPPSPPQCSYHADGPPAVDPFPSHTSKSFFNGLLSILLLWVCSLFIVLGNLLRGIVYISYYLSSVVLYCV